jgi:hypothetical protein
MNNSEPCDHAGNLGEGDCTICRDAALERLQHRGDAAILATFALEKELGGLGDALRQKVYQARAIIAGAVYERSAALKK